MECHLTWRSLRYPQVKLASPRSMIAKLPGQRNFMGSHLELICLLQAAEIERLSICLEEHRLKYFLFDLDSESNKEWVSIVTPMRCRSRSSLKSYRWTIVWETRIPNWKTSFVGKVYVDFEVEITLVNSKVSRFFFAEQKIRRQFEPNLAAG